MGRARLNPEGPDLAPKLQVRVTPGQAAWVHTRANAPGQSVGKVIRDLITLAMEMEQAQIRGWKLGLADKARHAE